MGSYGVVDLGGDQVHASLPSKVHIFGEKPIPKEALSELAILGRYVLPQEIWDVLEHVEESVEVEFSLQTH